MEGRKNRKRENGKGGEIKGGGGKRERGEKERRQGKRSVHLSAQILSHIHHTCAKCQTPHIKKRVMARSSTLALWCKGMKAYSLERCLN